MALQLGMEYLDSLDQQLLMAAYGVGSDTSLILPFSSEHEIEADEIGSMCVAKAG